MKMQKTKEFNKTVKSFTQLGIISLLTNMMNYFDKFLIFPLLGPFSVAVYYAVNSMSKVTSLLTNPLASVILSWISNLKRENNKKKIIKMTLLINIPLVVIITIIAIPCTFLALKLLYSQYLNDGMPLILPISIATAIGTTVALTKAVLLKSTNPQKLLYVYLMYFITFAVLGYIFSKKGSLIGFAFANLISKIVLWICFIVLLIKSGRSDDYESRTKEIN